MNLVFDSYGPGEVIPALDFMNNRKLMKYLNRETMAAVVAAGKLAQRTRFRAETPCYYATGMLEYEDYGLGDIVAGSRDEEGRFDPERFVNDGINAVSPLNQFKVLQNMPLSFVSITLGLRGDNAVVYASALGLLRQALCAPGSGPVIIGAGKAFRDGSAASGFAMVDPAELNRERGVLREMEAVEMFRRWSQGDRG